MEESKKAEAGKEGSPFEIQACFDKLNYYARNITESITPGISEYEISVNLDIVAPGIMSWTNATKDSVYYAVFNAVVMIPGIDTFSVSRSTRIYPEPRLNNLDEFSTKFKIDFLGAFAEFLYDDFNYDIFNIFDFDVREEKEEVSNLRGDEDSLESEGRLQGVYSEEQDGIWPMEENVTVSETVIKEKASSVERVQQSTPSIPFGEPRLQHLRG